MDTVKRLPAAATAAIVALALAALLAVAPLERGARERASGALDALRASVEARTGFTLSYGSLSPSILRSLSIRKLELRSPSGASSIVAERVLVYYDLSALARNDTKGFLRGFSLRGAVARLDAADLPLLARLFGGGGSRPELPRLELSGEDLVLEATGFGPGPLRLGVDSFRLDGLAADVELAARGDLSLSLAGLGALELPFSVSGLLARSLDRARLDLALSASSSAFAVDSQRFELSWSAGAGPDASVLELRKVRDAAPLDAFLRWEAATGLASATLRMDGYVPGSTLAFRGPLAALDPWLGASISGSLELALGRGGADELAFRGSLTAVLDGEALPPGLSSPGWIARLTAEGRGGAISIGEARVEGPDFLAEYSGSFDLAEMAPDGVVSLSAGPPGNRTLSARVRLYGGGRHYGLLAEEALVAGVPVRNAILDLSLDRKLPGARSADFSLSFLLDREDEAGGGAAPAFAGEAAPLLSASRVRAEGSLEFAGSPGLELSLSLDTLSFASLSPLLARYLEPPAASLAKGLEIDGEIILRTDFRRISYSATDLALASADLPGAWALLSFSGSERELKLRKATISYGGYVVTASGGTSFARAEAVGFDLNLELADVPYAIKGSLLPQGVFLTGDYGFALTARTVGSEVMASASATELPIPLFGAVAIAAFSVDARFRSPEDWSLALASLDLDPVGASLGGLRLPRLGLAGLFGPRGGRATRVTLADAFSTLEGSASLDYDLARPGALRARAVFASTKGESYALDAGLSPGGGLGGTLDFAGSPVERFWRGPLAGRLAGSATFGGSLAAPRLAFAAELSEGFLLGESLVLAAKGSLAEGRLAFADSRARWKGLEASGIDLLIDPAAARAEGDARLRMAFLDAPVSLSLAFTAEDLPLPGKPTLPLRVKGSLGDIAFRGYRVASWPFALVAGQGGGHVEGGRPGELVLDISPDGVFRADARSPFPFEAAVSGRVTGGLVEAEASGISLDLPLLLSIFGDIPLQADSGSVSGSLSVRGPVADPEFSGSLALAGAMLRVRDWVPEPIGPIDEPLLVDGKSISLSVPRARVGRGRVAITALAPIDGWIPSGVRLGLASDPTAPLPIATRILGIDLSGEGVIDISLGIDVSAITVSGGLAIERAEVVLLPEMLGGGGAGGPATGPALDVDLAVAFGKGVRVFFPSRQFPIVAGYADPSSQLAVRYEAARERLSLKGAAILRGGDVFYIQRNFFLKSARIAFNESFEKFDPLVTLTAELRDSTDKGPVLITLRADNVPIASFKPRLSSDPPMTETQIAAFLGEGLLGADPGGGIDLRRAAIAGSELIPQLNVTKAFEGRVRETLGLDVFYFQTRVLQRWIYDWSGAADQAGGGAVGLGDYLDETTLYAGKYLREGIFAHASASLSEDPLAAAGTLQIDSELGVEFDTPFGLLRWSVAPKSAESLFIGDQSLSLSWKLSY